MNITLIALALLVLTAFAERRHARRVARVSRLAFGPTGRPAPWTHASRVARPVGVALACWGALVLLTLDPVAAEQEPSPRASRQLLVVLDVSPSMNLADAGPEPDKVSRIRWAGRVLQGVLDRLDMRDTRISMIAFYSKALPILQDTTDRDLVSNMLDGLPMHIAFQPGSTDLASGIRAAFEMSRGWARNSTTLVLISDGDLDGAPLVPTRPKSIADVIVIGVGDPLKPTVISGRSSRQDQWVLKDVAARLGGYYHEGNAKHLPSSVVSKLGMVAPRTSDLLGLREAALVSIAVGASLLGLTGPALVWFGSRRPAAPARLPARAQGELA
jgi:Ca-activated chloride channel family protein